MRVRLLDRYGGARLERTVGLGAIVAGVVATWLAFAVPSESGVAAPLRMMPFASLAVLALALAYSPCFSPRTAELALKPGELRVLGGIGRTFRIVPGDVTGATTSVHRDGVALSLMLRTRPRAPVTLVFDGPNDAEAARRALGLGHDGFGETSWRTEEPSATRTARAAAWVALLCFLTATYSARNPEVTSAVISAIYGLFVLPFSLFRFKNAPTRRIALRPEAAYLPTPDGCAPVPYAEIARLESEGKRLAVHTGETSRISLASPLVPREEMELVASHLEAARWRARGLGASRVEVRERLSRLERNREEPVVTWIGRLDMLAGSLGAGGYRGQALDRADLELALEDADLPLEARVAAARVLARADRSDEVRVRIADTAATLRDPKSAEVLRAASRDPREIEEAFEELERDELRRAGIKASP